MDFITVRDDGQIVLDKFKKFRPYIDVNEYHLNRKQCDAVRNGSFTDLLLAGIDMCYYKDILELRNHL